VIHRSASSKVESYKLMEKATDPSTLDFPDGTINTEYFYAAPIVHVSSCLFRMDMKLLSVRAEHRCQAVKDSAFP
jgi:hypothetical protein